ncbi:WG repeat-containing protein [uncultured Cytophaga sp.]|uniref:WG repeat-containing protein n=1 Tax=uncultured Cytophaga sp. TaxID=160238 RepID=UPI00262E7228|nr:WG repeat-containing protein [uncultured Cytophaga sp.]
MIKSKKLIFTLFFCIATLLVTSAQDTSTTVSATKNPIAANTSPTVSYLHFNSDSVFNRVLQNKLFTRTYSVVSILDTLAGVPRKRTGLVQANKLILPFESDSIQHTFKDEFICRTSFFARKKYTVLYSIYQSTSAYRTQFKANHIDYLENNLYIVQSATSKYIYNSSTKQSSPTFDHIQKIDTLFYQLTTADESILLDRAAKPFISSPYKELFHSNDSVYNAVLFNEWDIYKNTGEKILSNLRCDSIKPSKRFSRWNLFRNGNSYYRWDLTIEDTTQKIHSATKNFSTQFNISKFSYDTIKLTLKFDSAYYQSDNWLMYKKAGAYGYCDTIGNVKISHQYDTITAWHNNMAAIRFKNKWGYINKREEMTVQPYYKIALPFYNGAAAVFDGKRWMFISKDGKNINSITFDSIQQTSSGRWYIFNKGLYGLCETNGRELIPPIYEYLLDGNSDLFVFRKDSLYGLIEKDRTIRCKPTYDQFIYDTANACYLLKHISQSSLLFILPTR